MLVVSRHAYSLTCLGSVALQRKPYAQAQIRERDVVADSMSPFNAIITVNATPWKSFVFRWRQKVSEMDIS